MAKPTRAGEGSEMPLFPLYLKLEDRPCLVVGAGPVGEAKIKSLLQAGAEVRVVAPRASETVRRWAETGEVRWRARGFEREDLEDMVLVVAATSSPEVHDRVYQEARRRGIPCNVVDDPARSDFYYPAVVRRGELQIAISTGGRSPALAHRLRAELEKQFGPLWEAWVDELGRMRRRVLDSVPEPGRRRRLFHWLASAELFEVFRRRRSRSRAANSRDRKGKVYLVGAGPGDPDLLTVKALRILQGAEVVLHDELVPPEILALAPPRARLQNVGKRCGKKRVTQEELNALMADLARRGFVVVRLKGGDPAVFSRAGEEMEALRREKIDFEVVPGVTAALAAAAAAKVSLTDRRGASQVIFATNHRRAGKGRADWRQVLGREATLVVYMPGSDYDSLAEELLGAGLAVETPCLIASSAAVPEEKLYATRLSLLSEAPRLPAPAVLIIGTVAGIPGEEKPEEPAKEQAEESSLVEVV